MSSEYQIPIFISSTDYNLVDLRAELAQHLETLGCRPILSSVEGFADYSPDLQPWESCLRVLDTCYLMVLVIDGRYGNGLEWPNFKHTIKEAVSPTHAEYLHAHASRKRMLVFVRDSLVSHYDSYRSVLKKHGKDPKAVRETMEAALPPYVDYDVFPFFAQVKTAPPIPWIRPFHDVTDIKSELQKKLLNQLAEVFLLREKHMEVVVRLFGEVIDGLPEEQREQVLRGIGATKRLIQDVEKRSGELADARRQLKEMGTLKAEGAEETKHLKAKIRELETRNADSIASSGSVINVGSYSLGASGFLPLSAVDPATSFTIEDNRFVLGNPSFVVGPSHNIDPALGYALTASTVVANNCRTCGGAMTEVPGGAYCNNCKVLSVAGSKPPSP